MLDDLRDAIKDAQSPQWIIDALTAMHDTYPDDQSLRYRSSTNNEDLPGFNGAGLYDSFTQKPDETEDDGVDKSLKQVYASLWNYRAFAERDFNRIDHLTVAMGVLVHPNYKDELVNGVAVSDDPNYGYVGSYYVNSQLGEDLVTNPEEDSVPEELLLYGGGTYTPITTSNLVPTGELLMTDVQLAQLRLHLEVIDAHFASLYNPAAGEPFAMEIEFKITSENVLAIKQARPWIYSRPPAAIEAGTSTGELTASFEDEPSSHDGTRFKLRLRFSLRTDTSLTEFTENLLQVSGGRVTFAKRLTMGGPEGYWELTIRPDGDGDVTIALIPNRPCTLRGSVCTVDGVRLSNRLDLVVKGPAGGTSEPIGSVRTLCDAPDKPIVPIITFIPGGGGGGGGGGPSGPTPSDADFEWTVKHDIDELDSGHDQPTGAWSDSATLWLLENGDGADDAVYAYDLEGGERVEDREFALDERNRAPRGIWSDGQGVVWVSDSGQDKLFAYDLATGDRLEDRDIELDERNADARGIWSDGQTMWVLDGGKDRLFAYDLESGALLAEYALDSRNSDPHGIWSDGVGIWVSNHDPKQLFAYRLPDSDEEDEGVEDVKKLERVRDEEFDKLSRASNNSPRGIWSDGDVMYVADASDGKVYTYNMPDAIDARLATLTLSGLDIGEFDPGRPEYEGGVGEGVTETTIEATTLQRRTNVAIAPVDADGDDGNGHQVSLQGVEEITVTVTSADGSRSRVYRVAVQRPEVELALAPTWTSIEWPGADGVTIAGALQDGDIGNKVLVVYHWDEATAAWLAYFPGLGDVPGLNTLTTLEQGHPYWVAVTEPVVWTIATRELAESRPASANNP